MYRTYTIDRIMAGLKALWQAVRSRSTLNSERLAYEARTLDRVYDSSDRNERVDDWRVRV